MVVDEPLTIEPMAPRAPAPVVEPPAVEPRRSVGPVYPPIQDPVGRSITIDERMLSEGMMFRYGYDGWTDEEIASEYESTVLWLMAVWRTETWLEKAYDAGIEARGRAERRAAEHALYGMTKARTTWKEQINKQTGEVVRLESEVQPSLPAVEKVLESRDPERWGKRAAPGDGAITQVFIEKAQVTLGERRARLAELTASAAAYGGDE